MNDGDKAVNAANANYKMWQSLGFAAQFAIGAGFPSLDPDEKVLQHFHLKLVILTALLIVGGILMLFITAAHPPTASDEDEPSTPGKGLLDDYDGDGGQRP